MSLQQLLNVTVVSKHSESIARSPGVVSGYDARELEALGLRTLTDFLHFVPGIELNERLHELRTVQIRGLPGKSNQKVLFMLDGVPYWMPESGDIPLRGLPIQGIERIEVIRGPGSVVYGANASAGVINIISRKDNGATLNAYATTSNTKNVSLYGGKTFENGVTFNLSAELQRDNGYPYDVENAFAIDPCFCFPATENGQLIKQIEHSSASAHVGIQGFSATLQSFTGEETGDINDTLVGPSHIKSKGTLVSLNYHHEFDQLDVDIFTDWNRYYRDIHAQNLLAGFFLESDGGIFFDNDGKNNVRFRQGATFNYSLSQQFSILAGIEQETRSTENKKFKDDQDGAVLSLVTQPPFNFPFELQEDNSILLVEGAKNREKSMFAQGDYTLDKWRFVLGLRYIDNSEAGSEISPRGSVVYSINDTESIKLLYSQGFNPPTFKQSAATDSFGLSLDNSVSAETIRTWDLAYTRTSQRLHYVLNVFHIEADDLIKSNVNINEVIKRNGAELDVQFRNDRFKIFSGLSYVHEGNGHGNDLDSDYASRWMLKFGVNYTHKAHSIGTVIRSAGERAHVDAYHLINISYQYELTHNAALFSTITNLLDDANMHPNVANLNTLRIQASDGTGLQAGFRVSF